MEAFIESFISSNLGITILSFISVNLAEILGLIIYIGKNGTKKAKTDAELAAKCEAYVKEAQSTAKDYIKKMDAKVDALDKKISAKIDEADFKKIEEVRSKQLEVEKNLEEVKQKLTIDEIIKD